MCFHRPLFSGEEQEEERRAHTPSLMQRAPNLDEYVAWAARTPSDINEHIATLQAYASTCESVAEFGVRSVVSTWAFLSGLVDAKAADQTLQPRLHSVDLSWSQRMPEAQRVAKENGVTLLITLGNCLDVRLDPPVDLLFIDTWHVYGQLKRELATHAPRVRRWIILHDTTVDGGDDGGEAGESVREGPAMGWDLADQARQAGMPESEVRKGLWPAVVEFLAAHPLEWALEHRYTHNNGLTVLARLDVDANTDAGAEADVAKIDHALVVSVPRSADGA